MKKKLMIMGVVFCLLMTPMAAWGESAAYSTGDVVTPYYTYVDMVRTIMSIENGTAYCTVTVFENTTKPFDYSKLTVYLKKSSGATVKTWTATKYLNDYGYFTWSNNFDLTSRGSYYIKAVNKLYKNDKLVETITTTSVTGTY